MRIGIGFDVHRLVPHRKLVLGGVEIPYAKGLLGHSDADVLCHAIGDAILGAAALGDLGTNFPATDQQYRGISSLILLEKISLLVKQNSFRVVNIDSIIIAEKPKMTPYFEQMKACISTVTNVNQQDISIKATTTEGLGYTGTGEGIAAKAVVLLTEN